MSFRLVGKTLINAARTAENALQRFFTPQAPALQLQPIGWSIPTETEEWSHNEDANNGQTLKPFGDIFEQSVWNMAVPKSKITPSRKRMKHKQHIPDPIGWSRCNKCGEPKRPHRICTKNIEVCAMRPEEYEEYLGGGAAVVDKTA